MVQRRRKNDTSRKRKNPIEYVGKFAWWDVWTAFDGVPVSNQFKVQLKSTCENAAYKLSSLGFPRMNSRILIKDLSDRKNQITGGGAGGFASREEHGFIIDNIDLYTIIHEHAHMIWFNLPKPNKQFFYKYYQKITDTQNFPSQLLWNIEMEEKESKVNQLINDIKTNVPKNAAAKFINNESQRVLRIYFESLSENNEDYNILKIMQLGGGIEAILTQSLTLQYSNSYDKKQLQKGDEVRIFKTYEGLSFIIEKRFDTAYHKLYETKVMPIEDVLKLIKVKKTEDIDKLLKYSKEIKKMKLSQILGGKNLDVVYKNLTDSFLSSVNLYFTSLFGRNSSKSLLTKLEQMIERYKSSWDAYIRLNSKKISSIKQIEELAERFLNEKLLKLTLEILKQPPEDYEISNFNISKYISYPKGEALRSYLAKQGKTASSYGAANLDEIWATSVEHAALGKEINKDLKKLIYQTINGF